MSTLNHCVDCGVRVSAQRPHQTKRCKPCAQRHRWTNPDDPRRAKLAARNESERAGKDAYLDREWLRERYEDRRLSLRQIAKESGCALRTIARWMEEHGIPTRDNLTALAEAPKRCGPKNPRWKGVRVCPQCGGSKAYGAKKCRACHGPTKRGAGNPKWRGLADVTQLVRQWTVDYWRPFVFARDRYTCQRCGDDRGGNLHAHHVVQLGSIIRRKRRAWRGELQSPEGRLAFVAALIADPEVASLDNGVTLCRTCHEETHDVVGWERSDGKRGGVDAGHH